MELLKLNNVTKYFGDYKATNNVSFSIKKGQICGLIGPNGAGKTTIIRQITNIYMPDEGEIILFGEPIKPVHQNRIAYLPEERGLYKKIKVIDMLVYFGKLKGLSSKDSFDKSMNWLRKLNADDWVNKKVQDLSKGMSQKIQFIGTILHDPEFLILDEPFSGFDPVNAEILKDIILELKQQGKTIILSTHVMSQVEKLCDDIILINKGQVILEGSLVEIKQSFGRNNLLFEFEGNINNIDIPVGLEIITNSQNRYEFKVLDKNAPNELIQNSVGKININKFVLDLPSIDEIFIETVGRSNLDEDTILEIRKN
ncbi:ATP-binding cassette domain-containing protein [Candidatus Kapabacteria bacterium]|nr:ATP-binding cassette domain-containing protein [Candidatus Kapabacteria bacterium]